MPTRTRLDGAELAWGIGVATNRKQKQHRGKGHGGEFATVLVERAYLTKT